MWAILLCCMVILPGAWLPPPTPITNISDTIPLAEKKLNASASLVNSVLTCHFHSGNRYEKRLRTWLLLDEVRVQINPEGAYELYLTDKAPEIAELSASQNSFITVLDLYSLTIPGRKKQLAIDITERVNKLYGGKKPLGSVYVVIKFGPIQMADGHFSDKAGDLRIDALRIVQTRD